MGELNGIWEIKKKVRMVKIESRIWDDVTGLRGFVCSPDENKATVMVTSRNQLSELSMSCNVSAVLQTDLKTAFNRDQKINTIIMTKQMYGRGLVNSGFNLNLVFYF